MRFVLVAALTALASLGWMAPASAASASDRARATDNSEPSVRWTNSGPRFERQRIARATIRDAEEDNYEAKPRRTYRSDRADNRRYTKRRQARATKRARRQRHATRRSGRRTAERRSHRVRGASVRKGRAYGYSGGGEASGIASFYWQPQRVAAGGWFNPEAMTAAHRTLPFGTRVRVTHMGNGRSVNVVINDRGPFIAGRIIDLSRGAARVIGMTGQGLARVKVTVVGRKGS